MLLIQAVGATTDTVYAGRCSEATPLGAMLAVLCSGILALLSVLKTELQRRAAAERGLDVLASTDPLTGPPNRRRFFERAEAHCAEAGRDGRALTVPMIDAEPFKSYDDRHGHGAGDRVLVGIASALQGEMRAEADDTARYGGEGSIVLLPGHDRDAALVVAEATRTAVARTAEPHERATAGIVTVGAGPASAEAESPPDLRAPWEAADAALYGAKRDGRNRSSGARRLLARYPRPEPRSA